MSDYLALMGCERKNRRFEPGDTVPGGTFPAKVVKHWLEKGVLAEIVGDEVELEEDVDDAGQD
ncbi:hypothetical protein LCGC14_0918660 [marine sediment metagenome]|uniref:Uncharacterized protein n=1 Tax=marine sediment metagenome TaxID=412755 RepID=A0A0F9NW81_9ZZZZ